jgi:hypothetical protein
MTVSTIFAVAAALGLGTTQVHAECSNAVRKPYNLSPIVYAPDQTRALGALVEVDKGLGRAVTDRRASCLPIPLRYNNPGSIQTPKGGWPNQTGKDRHGTATFATMEDGVKAFMLWVKRREAQRVDTAFKMISLYAPPDDCIGSVDKLPDGTCPNGFNDTKGYARKVSEAVRLGPNDRLPLDGSDGEKGRPTIRALLRAIMTFEVGADFCNRACDVEDAIFQRAADAIWGPVRTPAEWLLGIHRCGDPKTGPASSPRRRPIGPRLP